MTPHVITLFLFICVLLGSVQFADAYLAVSSVTDGVDGFNNLDGGQDIGFVTIGSSTYALVTSYYEGVQIIDISNPYSPIAVASISDSDVDVNGNIFDELNGAQDISIIVIDDIPYAIVVGNIDDGVQIIDISDPYFPLAVSSVTDAGGGFNTLDGARGVTTVVIDGLTYALVASFADDGVQIIDISNPYSLIAVTTLRDDNTFTELDGASDVTTVTIGSSTYALVAGNIDRGIQIIDISSPYSPSNVIGIHDGDVDVNGDVFDALTGARVITTVVIDDITYAIVTGNSNDGIQIIDITTPSVPLAVASILDGDVDVNGDVFDALDGAFGVTTVVIGDITYVLISSYDDNGVQIINITNPSVPLAVASIVDGDVDDSGNTFDELSGVANINTIVIDGFTYALVATFADDGLQIIDITELPFTEAPPANTFPVITIIGDNPFTLTVGETYVDQGFTCDDAETFVNLETYYVDDVDTNTAGTYEILYICFDNDFNEVRDIREVIVEAPPVDEEPPVITLNDQNQNPQIIELGSGYVELGATTDDGSIVIITDNEFMDLVGTYTIYYDSTDSQNNVAIQVNRTVTVEDTIAPTFNVGNNIDDYSTTVELDGNYTQGIISNIVDLSGTDDGVIGGDVVDVTTEADYIVTYTVTDDSPNANFSEITETVTVVDTTIPDVTPPQITLNEALQNPQIIKLGDDYIELGATCYDQIDGDITDIVITGDDFNTTAPGTHQVTYDCVDTAGNPAIPVIRDVQIVDLIEQVTIPLEDNMTDPEITQLDTLIVSLDLSGLVEVNDTIIIPELMLTTDETIVSFTNNTAITGLSGTDEIISFQLSTKTPTGFDSIDGEIIEFGSPDLDVTFNQPVRITLFEQGGPTPFYINTGNETYLIVTQCDSDDFDAVNTQLDNNECYLVEGDDLVIWTTHFTAFGSGTQSVTTTEKKSGGSNNQWMTKPTFGLSHETHRQLVDDGFRFNNNTFQITDNWHTPFPAQNVTLGEQNTFSAKTYAQNKLMIQEFLFGIPKVGDSHEAELGIEVWYDRYGNVTDTKIVQKTNVIDPDTLFAFHDKVKCQATDDTEKCDLTIISVKFLEPLKDDVMAIKAVDYKRRAQVTFLNEGFVISGDSLNPLIEKHIPGNKKHEGLIKITQSSKYSNYWFAEDGRIFEANDAGSLTQINKSFERSNDSGEAKKRSHSEFGTALKEQQIIAKIVSDYLYGETTSTNDVITPIQKDLTDKFITLNELKIKHNSLTSEFDARKLLDSKYPYMSKDENFSADLLAEPIRQLKEEIILLETIINWEQEN